MKRIFLLIILVSFATEAQILPERDRATLKDEILADRFNKFVATIDG